MGMLPAPSIRSALRMAIEEGDLGYGPTADRSGIGEGFAAWAFIAGTGTWMPPRSW